jgi:hypothetical protein
MFLAHSFRLRDPWQCESLPTGEVRWSRGFHRPTGLEDDDELWLVISGLPAGARVTLNGEQLTFCAASGSPPPCPTGVSPVRRGEGDSHATEADSPTPSSPNQYNVTALLADANCIEINVPNAAGRSSARFTYDARLAIVGRS